MPYLYQSFCYPDAQAVVKSFKSNPVIEGFGLLDDAYESPPGSITFVYHDASNTPSVSTYQMQTCDYLGYDNSFTGLTVDDAVLLGGMFMSVVVAAYCFTLIRRVI